MFARAGAGLCLMFGIHVAMADPIPVVQTDRLSASSVVAGPGASTVTVVYERTEFSLAIRMHLWATQSTDGGLTWSFPEAIQSSTDVHLCEPGLIRSPDGKQIAVLLRGGTMAQA